MKKSLVSLLIGASLAFSATAQDQAGGNSESAEGGMTTGAIATGVVAAGVLAAVISNNRGSADIVDPVGPAVGCEGTDELNADGFCVGSTQTVTGTGTATTLTTVTFTYAPQ
ncbi:hypothetical protein [Salinimonas lutimaris]|uniref:hypothetical protein n=1 Tax=Salinimonas lutimaris TaxID=914153 RepID=UPI0010BFB512|nr:hypothetical protein [Salinimonas lutimaris]